MKFSKGINYLLKNKQAVTNRPKGVAMLYRYDKNVSPKFEYETYNKTRTKLEEYYYSKHLSGVNNQKYINGQTACPGKITGIVSIVYNPKLVKDFKPGNILVTSMTRPEFIPLIKKAGAIITDEGGITCHAAIVSRELNIPCIIGTKVATKIFKDRQLVEVDANEGAVKILKRE